MTAPSKRLRRAAALVLCVLTLSPLLSAHANALLSQRTLSLEQARRMALGAGSGERYETLFQADQLFFETYVLQENAALTEDRLEQARRQAERTRAGLPFGSSTQEEADQAQSGVDALSGELAGQLRGLEAAKSKLSEHIGMDITVGYQLADSFWYTSIPREELGALTRAALENNDQTGAASDAYARIEACESSLRAAYGARMDQVQLFINMVKQGMPVDYGAFQRAYEALLATAEEGDAPPEPVYEACRAYEEAIESQGDTAEALQGQIRDTYETLVTAWNAYKGAADQESDARKELDRTRTLVRTGRAGSGEETERENALRDAKTGALEALKAYNITLSDLDRLSAGWVTEYLQNGGGGDAEAGQEDGADAQALLNPIRDPFYYLYTLGDTLTWYLGVSIPDNFAPAIDSYEVWSGSTQIGGRTSVNVELRYLSLDTQGKLMIRFYKGNTYVDECGIDPSVSRARLDIQRTAAAGSGGSGGGSGSNTGGAAGDLRRTVGTYTVSTAVRGGISMSELKLDVNAAEQAASYTLTYGEHGVYTTEPYPIDRPFSYLTLLIVSLDKVEATLYGKNGDALMCVRFDTSVQELVAAAPEN